MATYGSVARVFVQEVLNNDPSRYKSYHARFIGFVYPGEALTLSLWKKDDLTYIFEAETDQRKTKVLLGTFELKPEAKL
jgi:acyl dehydratase